MQERARVSSMDLKAHMNNLRKNPKFTEEILKLVHNQTALRYTFPFPQW